MKNPEHARRLLRDLRNGMDRRCWRMAPVENPKRRVEPSDFYGDQWSLLYGIITGIDLMQEGSARQWDDDKEEWTDAGISDHKWRENYEEYGHGDYGEGMKIGKRLAFYTGKFEFVEPEDSTEDGHSFTFTE